MNSDFMQQQGERLAQRLAGEPDNRARIQKAYRLIFGRAPNDEEIKAGLAFIASAPLKEYEERKAAAAKKAADEKAGAKDPSTALGAGDAKKDLPAIGEDGKPEKPEGADGMMAGVIPGAAKPEDQKKLLPVTPWGRYVKILLSSNEFLFVN
jgi:hypothetical protein